MPQITRTTNSPYAKLDAVAITRVTLGEGLWKRKRDVNHSVTIPHQYAECERTGRIDNFRRAAGLEPYASGGFRGIYFNDSDVYKWMEAATYSLASYPDPALENRLDDLIELIGQAQEEDGYLNTYFMFENKPQRWADLTSMHELYLGGHMIQAAIAHHRVTGKTSFLKVATEWADHVCRRFGPDRQPGAPGHPEIEMALVELYRETGEPRYLDAASFFIEQRGRGVLNGSVNLQDHLAIREQTYAAGHAVRQLYLDAGIADLYAERGDRTLLDTLLAQWADVVQTKMYITGGVGARREGEAFGEPYELPNAAAYAETCAAIASFMWNWRMLQIAGEARYADEMERALYNGILSGVSLDGKLFFYTNPLEHDGAITTGTHYTNRRTSAHWDGCACCPPNVARTLAALPGYFYGVATNAVYVHHYAPSTADIPLAGKTVQLKVDTAYPWEGAIRIAVAPQEPTKFALLVRRPGWANEARVSLNGENLAVERSPASYISMEREWQRGDVIELDFPMPVQKMRAHSRVAANAGCVALTRGPIVYCIEQADHPGVNLFQLAVRRDATFESCYEPELLGGVVVLRGEGVLATWAEPLYAPDGAFHAEAADTVRLTAIPYFAWANREPGTMRVWIRCL